MALVEVFLLEGELTLQTRHIITVAGTHIFIHVLSLVMVRGALPFLPLGILPWEFWLWNKWHSILVIVHSIYWTFKCRYQLHCIFIQGTILSLQQTSQLSYFCVLWNMAESMNEQDHILLLPFLWIDFTMCVDTMLMNEEFCIPITVVMVGQITAPKGCKKLLIINLPPGRLLPSLSKWCYIVFWAFVFAVIRLHIQMWE